MFKNLNETQKQEVMRLLEGITFNLSAGLNLSNYMSIRGHIGVLENGQINVVRNDERGNEMILEVLEDGDVFGSLIYPMSDAMEMITKTEVKIILIDNKRIAECNSSSAAFQQFLKNYNRILSTKIKQVNERINYLTYKTIRNRLLAYFKDQALKAHSRSFELPFSFTLLADYLAIDRSAMNRELKYLKEEKIISVKRHRVTLLIVDLV